jgi:hypothetical protein
MTRSLLDWTAAPSASPSPLPPLAAIRRGAFPVGLLPIRELAEDLARRGLTYRRSFGFVVLDERIDEHEAARMASSVLAQAAEELAPSTPRSTRLFADLSALDDETDHLQAAAHAGPADYESAEELFLTTSLGPRALAKGLRIALDAPNALALDRTGYADTWSDHRAALAVTARDVKASSGARAALLKALRAVLPAPTELDVFPPEDLLGPFWASLDGEDKLLRSALPALYASAGHPGNLSTTDLRSAASARWGEPRKFQGSFIYRPARAASAS